MTDKIWWVYFAFCTLTNEKGNGLELHTHTQALFSVIVILCTQKNHHHVCTFQMIIILHIWYRIHIIKGQHFFFLQIKRTKSFGRYSMTTNNMEFPPKNRHFNCMKLSGFFCPCVCMNWYGAMKKLIFLK